MVGSVVRSSGVVRELLADETLLSLEGWMGGLGGLPSRLERKGLSELTSFDRLGRLEPSVGLAGGSKVIERFSVVGELSPMFAEEAGRVRLILFDATRGLGGLLAGLEGSDGLETGECLPSGAGLVAPLEVNEGLEGIFGLGCEVEGFGASGFSIAGSSVSVLDRLEEDA